MYDVIIIGAGVIGCAVARELARYKLHVLVLEKGSDVSVGTSKANSGIVHAGYSERPGSLKAKYNVAGQEMFDTISDELNFSFKRCGSLIVSFDEDGMTRLGDLKKRGEANGIKSGLEILTQEQVRALEPNISDTVYGALHARMGGIVSPYGMTLAYAENAASNGVSFCFNCYVENITKKDGLFFISTNHQDKNEVKARVVVNAAGLYSDEINNMLSENKMKIIPRSGEYILLDTTEGQLVKRTIFQLPHKMGKGVLVSPTLGGVLLLGPTSVEIDEKDDISVTQAGITEILEKTALSVKGIRRDKIITSFTGLRSHLTTDDFVVEEAPDVPGLINLCGIESPGLTAAPAIAKEAERLVTFLLEPEENVHFNPVRKKRKAFSEADNAERSQMIATNADYGKIVCRCEKVTKAEVLDALRSPLSPQDVDALKRRTRLGMGRCQGGFCHMKVLNIIAEELKIDVTKITKNGGDSQFLMVENKKWLHGGANDACN